MRFYFVIWDFIRIFIVQLSVSLHITFLINMPMRSGGTEV